MNIYRDSCTILQSPSSHQSINLLERLGGIYATEAEADLHGITFGQRIIDGKVPGLSVG
jgi:hypothetical protein